MGAEPDKPQQKILVDSEQPGSTAEGQHPEAQTATNSLEVPHDQDVALVQAQMLESVALALAEQIVEEKAGSGAGSEPRVMRLLKRLDPDMHKKLAQELKAVLNLLKSPTIAEQLKVTLRQQMRKILESRLGPAFKQITVAEGFLADPSSHFAAAAAAINEVPALYEVPGQPAIPGASVKPVCEAARLLQALEKAADEAFFRCRGAITEYMEAGFNTHTGKENVRAVNQGEFLIREPLDENKIQLIEFLMNESTRLGILIDLQEGGKPNIPKIKLFSNKLIFSRYQPPASKIQPDPQAQNQVLTPLAAILAEGVRNEKLEPGKEPRAFRLLKTLDHKLYEELKKELADLLTLLETPAFDDTMKQALQDQIDATIEQKIGAKFRSIRLAEFVLADIAANLPSLAAAVEQVAFLDVTPTRIIEFQAHDDQSVVDVYHTAHALMELTKAAASAAENLQKLFVAYFQEAGKQYGFEIQLQGKNRIYLQDSHRSNKADNFMRWMKGEAKKLGINMTISPARDFQSGQSGTNTFEFQFDQ